MRMSALRDLADSGSLQTAERPASDDTTDTPCVVFDESGNTGADLLHPEQPVFVLASADFSVDEAKALLDTVRTRQTGEAKLSRLKKTASGQRRVLRFFEAVSASRHRLKACCFHKRYLVVTKIVDLLEENLAYRHGVDLYRDGANVAISNVHFYRMPVECGAECAQTVRLRKDDSG
jgi:hypothetical protein